MKAIADLKTERDEAKKRVAEIDAQLAEIAGTLPRRRRAKDEKPARTGRSKKQPAAPVEG
ncbi:MAG TPA: hypothetical protein VI078_13650 [bacterium]